MRGCGDMGDTGLPPAGTGLRLTAAPACPRDPFPPTFPTGISRVPVSLLPLLWANDRKGSGSLCFLTSLHSKAALQNNSSFAGVFPKSGSLHIPGPQPVKAKG